MSLHDAVLDFVTLNSERRLRISFSEIPGRTAERLVIEVETFQCVVMLGVIEKDWFLSGVFCYLGDGTTVDPFLLKDTPLARLVVLGTDGASVEVMLGKASATIEPC